MHIRRARDTANQMEETRTHRNEQESENEADDDVTRNESDNPRNGVYYSGKYHSSQKTLPNRRLMSDRRGYQQIFTFVFHS